MGQALTLELRQTIPALLAALAQAGVAAQVAMIDGQLVLPSAPVPPDWQEVRLRTPAGMVTLRRHGSQVTVTVFGNADARLIDVRDRIASVLAGG